KGATRCSTKSALPHWLARWRWVSWPLPRKPRRWATSLTQLSSRPISRRRRRIAGGAMVCATAAMGMALDIAHTASPTITALGRVIGGRRWTATSAVVVARYEYNRQPRRKRRCDPSQLYSDLTAHHPERGS